MRQLFALLFATTLCTNGFSQAYLTVAQYQKTQQPAVQVDIPFLAKTVDKAIEDKMNKLGYKSSSDKDYTVYKNVRLPELSDQLLDLYFESNRKSRAEKGVTTLTLLVSTGYGKFASDTTDATLISNARQFLNNLIPTVTAYDLELQITDQQSAVKKAEKKLSDLTDDGNSLQKKKKKLEDDISDNTKAQAAQQAELDRQKQILSTLLSKRK